MDAIEEKKRDIRIKQLKNLFFYTFGILPLAEYNVVGDGITDNRLQIQQAIYDAIEIGVKYIFVEKGEYYYSGTLQRAEELVFVGNSTNAKIEGIEIKQFPEMYADSDAITKELSPIGTIELYCSSSENIPDKYLLCNGSSVSKEDYASLFEIIGTTAEKESTDTTFNLPSLTPGETDTRLKYIIKAK